MPYRIYAFRLLQQTLDYFADGTVKSVKDGLNREVQRSGWKRGVPHSVVFADLKGPSAVVSDQHGQ